jgi:hypothetical protein
MRLSNLNYARPMAEAGTGHSRARDRLHRHGDCGTTKNYSLNIVVASQYCSAVQQRLR